MRSVAFSILAVMPLALGTAAANEVGTLDLSDYDLAFAEEFDTLSVSPWGENGENTRWIAHTPWAGDFGDARFADPQPGFPFTIEDGILRIEARKTADGTWESGLLAANPHRDDFATFTQGYFEVRMKMPVGKGTWPAFWLSSPVESDGYGQEIDVIEYYGHDDTRFQAVWHLWPKVDTKEKQGELHWKDVEPGSLAKEFHTFGVNITDDRIDYYFDRKLFWSIEPQDALVGPYYPLVNLALGSGWPIDETPNPSYLWVDYIRVYTKAP